MQKQAASLEQAYNTPVAVFSDLRAGGTPIIAVDLDDVLAQTSKCAADWHNSTYGSSMHISNFYYSMWYKCPGWGTIPETLSKVQRFYAEDELRNALPVPGALEGLEELVRLGFRPVIVMARVFKEELDSTRTWLKRYFPNMFQHVIFSKQDVDWIEWDCQISTTFIATTRSKVEICNTLQSAALIDDSLETALACERDGKFHVLLFGGYEWSKRIDDGREWCFGARLKQEGGNHWWQDEDVDIGLLSRVRKLDAWEEIVTWLKAEGHKLPI